MSVQTHTQLGPCPESAPFGERLRYRFQKLIHEPNPVWVRELRQSARLTRTPIILAVVTSMITLLIASIGGVLSVTAEPAQVGVGIFHTFFSLAFAVVTWVGPAVAAATIASERSGRTWEALLLTGLSPTSIAKGKFLAAFTYVLLYIVMLAPVGGLAFLFGGVTPSEVVVAFVLLVLIAALAVAFGLAMSSKFSSPALAILVTLFVAVPISILVYVLGGVGLSVAVNRLWPAVSAGAPVWLPTALTRADFSLNYLLLLLVYPLLAVSVPAWFYYEVTIANMAPLSDDRSTRLRVWALVSGLLLAIALAVSRFTLKDLSSYVAGQTLLWAFLVEFAFLLASEPLGPSHRVEARWQSANTGRLRRWLGPGVGRAGASGVLLASASVGILMAAGVLSAATTDERLGALSFGGYTLGFALFLIGFSAFVRARAKGPAIPRVLLAGALFLAILGPYIAMAISGVLLERTDKTQLIAAPSPAFAFEIANDLSSPGGDAELFALVGGAASVGWGLLGLTLLALGSASAKKRHLKERTEAGLSSKPIETVAAPS